MSNRNSMLQIDIIDSEFYEANEFFKVKIIMSIYSLRLQPDENVEKLGKVERSWTR